MNQNTQSHNNSLREELAWFIVERMNDSVGFDEAYEEVGEYLKIIEKRIDELRHTDELEYQDEEVDYGITLFHNMIKKELLK